MHIFWTPFIFLRVIYPKAGIISWLVPICLSAGVIAISHFMPGRIKISGEDGFLERVITVMTISGGFFVTSLTVILTNESKIVNSIFVGEGKPRIKGEDELLTRKRFLSLLFGYISFISFAIVGLISFALVMSDPLKLSLTDKAYEICLYVSGFILLVFLFQIFLFSLVGLHYLTDRLHRSDGRSQFSKPIPDASAGVENREHGSV